MRTTVFVVVGTALLVLRFFAQTPGTVAFEAVSIKRHVTADAESTYGFQRGGRFLVRNQSLMVVVRLAYGGSSPVPGAQVVGAPSWLDNERYDVDASGPDTASPEAQRAMLRSLLVERLKFAAHEERREVPTYDLVFARSDHRPGPNLQTSDVDCAALRRSGAAPDQPRNGGLRACVTAYGDASIESSGNPLSVLAGSIARFVDRPVVDRTATGERAYGWRLQWQPDGGLGAGGGSGAALPSTIFSAAEEELGLKLEPSRAEAAVIVIDHVERPTPD